MYCKGMMYDGVKWIHLSQNRDQWQTVVNAVLKLVSPFLNSQETAISQEELCCTVIFNYTNEGTFKNPFILWALYVK
jgi:hypothetical protein